MIAKRRYEKIEKISNNNSKIISYNKRIKVLIKKGIELSVLCDQDIFIYVYDKEKKRMLHFASDPELDPVDLF